MMMMMMMVMMMVENRRAGRRDDRRGGVGRRRRVRVVGMMDDRVMGMWRRNNFAGRHRVLPIHHQGRAALGLATVEANFS
jgi:hypothetical protein